MTSWRVRLLFPAPPRGRIAVALLALRGLAGVALVLHGRKKIADPLHWMDAAPWVAPAPLQLLAATAEFFGGIALVLGALTTVAAFGVLCTMVVAAATHIAKGDPFIGRWELAAMHAAVAFALMMIGPGAISIDAWIARRAARPRIHP